MRPKELVQCLRNDYTVPVPGVAQTIVVCRLRTVIEFFYENSRAAGPPPRTTENDGCSTVCPLTGLMPSAGLCRGISLRPASGRYWKGSDLGIIRRTDSASKPIFRPSPREDPSNIGQSGWGHLGNCAANRCSSSVVLQNYAGRVEPRRALIVAPGRSHRLLLGIIRNSA
jgi:hypothetical protein